MKLDRESRRRRELTQCSVIEEQESMTDGKVHLNKAESNRERFCGKEGERRESGNLSKKKGKRKDPKRLDAWAVHESEMKRRVGNRLRSGSAKGEDGVQSGILPSEEKKIKREHFGGLLSACPQLVGRRTCS